MPKEFPDKLTPVGKPELIEALWYAWLVYFGSAPPKRECLWVIAAQWALETGWGKSMHNYNLGNVKSSDGDGYDWCYYECNEAIPKAMAERYQSRDPAHAKITAYRNDGNCWIWFYPPHTGCRFRAFETLNEGAVDQIKILANRFSRSWPAVLTGDPVRFVHELKMTGYFTADEIPYRNGVLSIFNTISKMPIDYDSLPIFTDAEKQRIDNLVAMTILDIPVSDPSDDT
jgi:hypothetical protein